MTIRVPGKAFLFGEYAVLFGAPAAVMAIRRHVRVTPAPAGTRMAPLVLAGRRQALAFLGRSEDLTPWVADSSGFEDARGKLGLGSSSAVAVGAVASVFVEAGLDLRDPAIRRQVRTLARAVHDRHQGQPGSGADVAAAVHGGRLIHRRNAPDPLPWTPPQGLEVRFARCDHPVSTADRIEVLYRVRTQAPDRVNGPLDRTRDLAEALARESQDLGSFLRLAEDFTRALVDLGTALDRPMLGLLDARLREAVQRRGGVLKPSGAGGGDLLVAFLPGPVAPREWHRLVWESGLQPLDLSLDETGVFLEGA